HTVDVFAPGYKPFHKDIAVDDSGVQSVVVVLVETGATSTRRVETNTGTDRSARRTMGISLTVGGGVALISGVAIGLYARDRYNQCVVNGVARETCLDGQDGFTAANSYRTLAHWVATPLVIGGAAVAGLGTYLLLTLP